MTQNGAKRSVAHSSGANLSSSFTGTPPCTTRPPSSLRRGRVAIGVRRARGSAGADRLRSACAPLRRGGGRRDGRGDVRFHGGPVDAEPREQARAVLQLQQRQQDV